MRKRADQAIVRVYQMELEHAGGKHLDCHRFRIRALAGSVGECTLDRVEKRRVRRWVFRVEKPEPAIADILCKHRLPGFEYRFGTEIQGQPKPIIGELPRRRNRRYRFERARVK